MSKFGRIAIVVIVGISVILILDRAEVAAGIISGVGAFTILLAAVVGRNGTLAGSRLGGLGNER
jgi:hypothetical protein